MTKDEIRSEAERLVDWMFNDMDDRSFDTGGVDSKVLWEWREAWIERVTASL